ncbi:ABC transporter substrate-binding protein, partial [bacterium]|nr:ABC transporter substrate-binding protein [bacterium]
MKTARILMFVVVLASLVLSACGPQTTPTPVVTEAPTVAITDVPVFSCGDGIQIGLITDVSGALAIYGAHIVRSFMLGMEYATGAAGTAGPVFNFAETQENTFTMGDCQITVYVADDQSTPDTTATIAREFIEVRGVDLLIGTVSSGATATLQGIAAENQIPLIVAPAAANDITGVNFNEYTFRTSRNNYQDAINECAYLTQQYSTFVQIAPDYAFGRGSAAAFRDACMLDGGTFAIDDIFAPLDTTDFTPYMEQIKNSGAEAY